jgi:DNA-binding CsgD family transcriptional regulator
MAFPGISEVDLILALQDGAAGGGSWSGFLARLAGLTGARFAAMISRVPGLAGTVDIVAAMPSGDPAPTDAAALAFILTERMRPERIYAASELSDLTDTGEGLSLDTALGRLGAVSVNAMRVAVPTVTIGLGVFGARTFDAADGAVLRRLFPYLHAAARTASRVWHERLHVTMTADLARRHSLGWFLLDRAGTVLDSWTATPAIARSVRVLPGGQGDHLALADRAAEPALAAMLDRFGREETPRAQALWVSHDPPLHLRIAPVPREWTFDPRQPAALATLHGELRLAPDTADLLVDLFGLLPSEARLAAALADGDRMGDAADRLGLTIETVRNYSKKIFAKTGTRGQPDLVRLIYASGLAALDRGGPARSDQP